jgi:hypothetical protein
VIHKFFGKGESRIFEETPLCIQVHRLKGDLSYPEPQNTTAAIYTSCKELEGRENRRRMHMD